MIQQLKETPSEATETHQTEILAVTRAATGNTTAITYLNDELAENPVVLVKTQDNAKTKYWYGNERLCTNDDFYLYDGQGSVTMQLSGSNQVLSTYSYSDYGRRDKKYNPFVSSSDEYGYRSEAHNSDETQYLRARYYDTVTELFISADGYRGDWQDPLSQNRYNYGRNNPNKYFDPRGMWSIWGAVKNTVNKVVNTVKKTVNNVVNTVKKTVNNVVNTVKNTFNPPKQNPATKKNNNNPTDARTAPPIYSQYDKAIQYPSNSGGGGSASGGSGAGRNTGASSSNNTAEMLRKAAEANAKRIAEEAKKAAEVIRKQAKEKRGTITTGVQESISALTKKQEEERNVKAIMASIQGPRFNVDFLNKVGSLYNRFSGWCNERGKEIKEVGDNFKKGGKELGDQLNEALLGGLQNVSDSVVAASKAISNMTWKDWTKAAISVSAGAVTFAAFFVPGGGVVGAVVNGFIAGGMAGAAGSIAGDSFEVVDAVVTKNQDELFDKYGVKDWSELGNRVLDQAGTSMVKGAIFGSLAAGTQEYIGSKQSAEDKDFSIIDKEKPSKSLNSAETQASINKKLESYLLNKTHPSGGSKAKWFEEALGFNQTNKADLSKQIIFNPDSAVQTSVTEYGIKFNQVIKITGANGRVIDVTFAWIENEDGVIRLVTAIPTKK